MLKLQYERIKQGYNLKQFAEDSDVSIYHLINIEQGQVNCNSKLLERLSNTLNTEITNDFIHTYVDDTLNKDDLKRIMFIAKKRSNMYISLVIQANGIRFINTYNVKDSDVILDRIDKFYNDNLVHKKENVKIVYFTYGNTLKEIEDDIHG